MSDAKKTVEKKSAAKKPAAPKLKNDYKVADISLAAWGRMEMDIAETECRR